MMSLAVRSLVIYEVKGERVKVKDFWKIDFELAFYTMLTFRRYPLSFASPTNASPGNFAQKSWSLQKTGLALRSPISYWYDPHTTWRLRNLLPVFFA